MTTTQQTEAKSVLIGTTNHGFAQYAQEEVRRLLPDTKFTVLEPGEVFFIHAPYALEEVVARLKQTEPMFLRHIQPVTDELAIDRTRADLDHLIEFVRDNISWTEREKVAIQTRKLGAVKYEYTPYGVKEALDAILVQERGVEPVVRGADRILSIFLTQEKAYLGLSRPEDNLSDWSGGAVRYQKEEGQISRAKFKLLEAEERFDLDFAQFETAMDIGAAPGGWTSLLLERGCHVTAIDPGEMHESLLDEPNLTFLQKNAADVHLDDESFDLLVCDMSWSPKQMSKLVADLLPALRVGGVAIVTVKLMHKKPFQTVKEILNTFGPEMELMRAKQLFHNREELTLYLMKM
ncbi:MAG TPA: SAM-dependent methyltransferase [Bacilli bacterium]|nr:SAM-dependent methyltransferase [Bacilli bacterium]